MEMAKEESRSVVDPSYQYETLRIRGKDGKLRYIRGTDDAVARALTLHSVVNGKDLTSVARANKVDLLAEYPNPGQLRMALGNKLRPMVNRGEAVTIGDVVVKSLEQKVPLPIEPTTAAATARRTAKKTTTTKVVRRKVARVAPSADAA
jgi:hypothetical protein